jgi:hypothetical protein
MSIPPDAIKEALERLVDPPTDQSASLTLLAKIEQEAKSLPTLAEYKTYTDYLKTVWNNPDQPVEDLGAIRSRLVGDAGRFNRLLREQIELAQNAQSLDDELKTAWSAAGNNAQVARDLYQKANLAIATRQDELQRLQARVQELEKENSIKDLLVTQHKEVLGELRAHMHLFSKTLCIFIVLYLPILPP